MPDNHLADNSSSSRTSRSHTSSALPGHYPRRQASFESPRQVPLPSPSQKQADAANYFSSLHLDGDEEGGIEETEEGSAGVAGRRKTNEDNFDRFSSASLPLPSQIPFYALPRLMLPPDRSIPQSIPSPQPNQDRSGIRSSVADSIASSSSESSSNSSSSSVASSANTSSNSFDAKPSPSPPTDPSSAAATACQPSAPITSCSRSQHAPRPVSPFRAPQPPPVPPPQPTPQPTAMRRSLVSDDDALSFPPPEPPTILPAENTHDPLHPSQRYQAPYAPFLSHAPPPPDSWIEVETTHSEYRLHVRLPGFSREGITLATKRRRILHVVADRWENGGGHFERRISFGYDADLVQVRAEFDGIMLRITVPRRISLVTWQPRSGSSHRM